MFSKSTTNIAKSIFALLALCLTTSYSANANQVNGDATYEFTPYFGYMFGSDISSTGGDEIELSNDGHFGIAFSWKDSPQGSGQGQVLINYVSHEFDSEIDGSSEDLNILYTHFSGVALFRQQSYVTTFSLGLGGAYLDSDYESGFYPSATVAFGTRYEFSPFFALTTELRAYATLTDEDEDLFCKNDVCAAEFDDALYIDTAVSIGLAFAF
ncbi:hypothetical protein HII17_04900 [Thalassotalea sp. M1531]|uniref:Outer membrane protein beta-barrel domain-containing protein n=1 Tax=Thalassotalea algicola TaxID=2716224 RepID=A0A7Y0LD11_9GAMM|nr:hypothetical protein [Thalassotalea algicola]NMP30895.1 hypothetical protein [Thalassotalea algicola]